MILGDRDDALALIAAVEAKSEHPLAKAIVASVLNSPPEGGRYIGEPRVYTT